QSVNAIEHLFTRNERVIAYFSTEFGKMAVVLVGAMIVGSIAMQWAGVVTPPNGKREIIHTHYDEGQAFAKGDEIGQFQLGSTVIVLVESPVHWQAMTQQASVTMGQLIATVSE
ncbi:MAG: phosphatidylserine decarboxylase, partial [Coxiellaceae bacterium]|nr:phosphatidylserine decarboxylase [Coxiellaceae bacterium]